MSRLPREFLWKDLESMEDFFVDPLNKELYHVYCQVKEAPFRLTMPDVEVFNELYYLCIALNNECISFSELDEEIESNFCRKNTTDLLIAMIYSVFSLQKKQLLIMDQFGVFLESYQKGWYFDHFEKFIKKHTVQYQSNLMPQPCNPQEIKTQYINWAYITSSYSMKGIRKILSLWRTQREKLIILQAIETSYHKSPNRGVISNITKKGGITTYSFESEPNFDYYRLLIASDKDTSKPLPSIKKSTPYSYPFIIKSECAERVINKLLSLVKDKKGPKDKVMPVRAAIDAGAIRRPTFAEIQDTFGKGFVSNSSYHNYTNPDQHPYDANPSFTLLVSEFKKIVE